MNQVYQKRCHRCAKIEIARVIIASSLGATVASARRPSFDDWTQALNGKVKIQTRHRFGTAWLAARETIRPGPASKGGRSRLRLCSPNGTPLRVSRAAEGSGPASHGMQYSGSSPRSSEPLHPPSHPELALLNLCSAALAPTYPQATDFLQVRQRVSRNLCYKESAIAAVLPKFNMFRPPSRLSLLAQLAPRAQAVPESLAQVRKQH
jgi:hypothetical protein